MSKHLAFLIVVISLFMVSCFKENIGPQGPAGPLFVGTIRGHVWLYDQYGTRMDTGLANAQVTLTNGVLDTVVPTDASGAFTFPNITTGNYTITAHVLTNGYGDTQLPDFQYLSGTLNKDVKMSVIPNFWPDSVTAIQSAATPNDSLVIYFTADTHARSYIIFINSSATINGTVTGYLLSYVKNLPANQTKATVLIPASDLHDVGINTGATAYYAVYGYPVANASPYEDISTGKNIYTALSPVAVYANAVAP